MTAGLTLAGLSCRYPDADSPQELWQNCMEGRLSFREMPTRRLDLSGYGPKAPPPDRITRACFGLLHGWHFDCARHRQPRSTFEQTDLSHWLALDLAAECVEQVGLRRLDRETTAVLVGNTLTGEMSRTTLLRLRLPYLLERLDGALGDRLDDAARQAVQAAFAAAVQADLPDPTEDTLAGGLANTIAGRIANHFDLRGGAFSVDGACASSHVAIAQAAGLIATGRASAVLVGAVDISLDPFELVGFSRNGALSDRRMRVFDRLSAGFWPAEGGGFVLLMDSSAAHTAGIAEQARLLGWGLSTDGAGGLTRPSRQGQALAIRRGLHSAGLEPVDLGYIEAHGTGTAVGDPIEIAALNQVFAERGTSLPVGSVKANIGHAKAAAGFAGLAKVIAGFDNGVIPPHAGCEIDAEAFSEGVMRVARAPVAMAAGDVAGISGFGFGGINGHLVLQKPDRETARHRQATALPLVPVFQEHELFCLGASTAADLQVRLEALIAQAETASLSEMSDIAAEAAGAIQPDHGARAAIIANRPSQLRHRAWIALNAARSGMALQVETEGVWVGVSRSFPRIGFLFPGQAAPVRSSRNAWTSRFEALAEFNPDLCEVASVATDVAQPAIIASSLAGLRLLDRLCIRAEVAVGHSLGELAALYWSGILSEYQCRKLTRLRGRVMEKHGGKGGAMARVEGGLDHIQIRALEFLLDVACLNAPDELVVSGPEGQIRRFVQAMASDGIVTQPLAVSHAFHSGMMQDAHFAFRREAELFSLAPPRGLVISTVTGQPIADEGEVLGNLTNQLVAPVLFTSALNLAAETCDIFVEVGAGRGLSRLAAKSGCRCVATDAMGDDLRGLMETVATLFVMGTTPDLSPFFADRNIRPANVPPADTFLASPCGGPVTAPATADQATARPQPAATAERSFVSAPATGSVKDQVRAAIAAEMGFQLSDIHDEARLAEDLHLSSIAVGRIVAELRASLGITRMAHPTDLSAATVGSLAEHLAELSSFPGDTETAPARIEGAAPWVRCFERRWAAVARNEVLFGDPAAPVWHPMDAEAKRLCAGGSFGEPSGALITVPDDIRYVTAAELWARVKAARARNLRNLAIVHCGMQLDGFAASLLAEGVFDSLRLIDVPGLDGPPDAIRDLLSGRAQMPHLSLRLVPGGSLERPFLKATHPPQTPDALDLGPDDLILVTGGAKGIGAECALRLAARTGARLLLVGRSSGRDEAVTAVLARAKALAISAAYVPVDISNYHRATVRLAECELKLGKITAVIHAAGVNRPARFGEIDETELSDTFLPKLEGFESILALVDAARLKLVVSFGSIIGHIGLAGETHYALANAFLGMRLAQWHGEPAHRGRPPRYLGLDWSVWGGLGMGERLGAVERLAAQGVDAIPLETGLDLFEELCADTQACGNLVLTSRFRAEDQPWCRIPPEPLRFIERILTYTPDVELVADCDLSPGSDPYLLEHMIEGRPVMPGVMLMEAMAQAARTLSGEPGAFNFADIVFEAPVWCPIDTAPTRIRTAVLRQPDGQFLATIRTALDGFAKVAMRARLIPRGPDPEGRPMLPQRDSLRAAAFQGPLLFSTGRLFRLDLYDHLDAFEIGVRLAPTSDTTLFGPFQPQDLVLGDAALRDSGLQALLAAVPQLQVLPASVAEVRIASDGKPVPVRMEARQCWADETRFCFDLRWFDARGNVTEHWSKAEFARVGERARWPRDPALAAVYLEREIQIRTGRSDQRITLSRTRDADALVHRGDGKPLPRDGHLSRAHTARWHLNARSDAPIAVDIVAPDEDPTLTPPDTAATLHERQIVWAAREAQRKAGRTPGGPLSIDTDGQRGIAHLDDDLFVFIHDPEAGLIGVLVPVAPGPSQRSQSKGASLEG